MKNFIVFSTIALSVLLVACTTNLKMKTNEIELIQRADVTTPFRVLQITNKEDSLILRRPCTDVDPVKDSAIIKLLIERMKVTMNAESGVGIAAPQIGLSRNIFLFVRVDKPNQPVEVAINPKIINTPNETICFERDGCLSIPGVSGNSIRFPWIDVEYINEAGEQVKERLEGYSRTDNFVSVIFQHEFDHLQGVIFTDKLCDLQ